MRFLFVLTLTQESSSKSMKMNLVNLKWLVIIPLSRKRNKNNPHLK
ncbi:hypothetical protein [Nonlabens dokdonensis]|uniref:Uncharacterized protein n=1 Tax=Nonlabens dokdonensis (strain DSM 17205 / KCTC 12402 / DSW-6) TaxID=592029 RepID=L7W832_NONDD|nr:hypothetical protein [Nonlabens dokdonensis]AGC77830.1 hypothetical protein DDD_2703 [Nonlabens dokdonensis DSW-6]